MKLNSELRAEARQALSGKWASPVIATLVYFLISCMVSGVASVPSALSDTKVVGEALNGTGSLLSLLIVLPLGWSFTVMFLKFIRTGEEIQFGEMFEGFKDYKRIFCTMFLQTIYILLWCLLLFVPGIIKSYSYAMTSYLMKDDPELGYNAAIEKSMKMMEGHKMQLFLLDLSFIGWAILSIFTLGIGLLWLEPYMMTARAKFYEDLKAGNN